MSKKNLAIAAQGAVVAPEPAFTGKMFKVVASTASKNGGFVTTIEWQSAIKLFGLNKRVSERYCITTLDQVAIGTEVPVDFSLVRIEEYEGTMPLKDANGHIQYDEEGAIVMRKTLTRYLHAKVA